VNKSSKSRTEKSAIQAKPKPFNKKLVREFEEFFDRVSKQEGCGVTGRSSINAGSIWNISNVLSSAISASNLQSFVDGPIVPAAAPSAGFEMPPVTSPVAVIPSHAPTGQYGAQQPLMQYTQSKQPPMHAPNQSPAVVPPATNPTIAAAIPAAVDGNESQSGLVGKVRKGILGWLYPDAHDASENLGTENKAYFDKTTGRWVFPGEENTEKDANMGPPPMMGAQMGAPAPAPAMSSGER
jgi:hypothetical protein